MKTSPPYWRRFLVHGVFWRQFNRWAVLNLPIWLEPIGAAWWSLFFLLWGPGRRGVMSNLRVVKRGSTAIGNFFRTYRVFWNYAWTMTDNIRFKELRTMPDWEFHGLEWFDRLQSESRGAIVLTAHMGSYDLGAHLFAERSERRIVMVRAPEVDPDTRSYEQKLHERTLGDGSLQIDFNTSPTDLAIQLLDAARQGAIIAIQGDRVTPGVATIAATLFGRSTVFPAGPFALAMAARVPIYPLFVVRQGRRRYGLITCEPIVVERRSRQRDADLQAAVAQWSATLEQIISRSWYQWFAFEPNWESHAA